MKLYRSISTKDVNWKLNFDYKSTMRPPGNIPYVVDNLWEWKRPDRYPNRRFSAYASPNHKLALESGPENGSVFCVEFPGEYKLAQLRNYTDSKYHPECKTLKASLIKILNEESGDLWLNWSMDKKIETIGLLWMPCLRKNEIDILFEKIPLLRNVRDKVASIVKYWDDVELIGPDTVSLPSQGEIFFEAKDGYNLIRCTERIRT